MTMADYQQFKQLWSAAAEVCVGKAPSDAALSIVYGVLVDAGLALDEIRNGLITHLQTSRFQPTAADVIEAVKGRPEDRAISAWPLVLKAARRSDLSARFDDPAVHKAICDMGGLVKLGMAVDNDDLRRDFVKCYCAAVRSGADWQTVPEHLAGRAERTDPAWTPQAIAQYSAAKPWRPALKAHES